MRFFQIPCFISQLRLVTLQGLTQQPRITSGCGSGQHQSKIITLQILRSWMETYLCPIKKKATKVWGENFSPAQSKQEKKKVPWELQQLAHMDRPDGKEICSKIKNSGAP